MATDITVNNKIESNQSIKISIFNSKIRKTNPHRHQNYFEIIFLFKGNGIHFIDNKGIAIESPIVFFVRKEQIHHWNITSFPKGFVIILKKEFVDNSLDNELKKLIADLSAYSYLHLTDFKSIEKYLTLMFFEKNPIVIEGLFKSLLAKLFDCKIEDDTHKNNKNNLYQTFIALLMNNKDLKNSVLYYANTLNTTPQNLNAVCRKSVNQSASQLLSDYIIAEAKRLLIYTDKTVSEIAFTLGFNDVSHFVKYFKRFVNKTPVVFRKE